MKEIDIQTITKSRSVSAAVLDFRCRSTDRLFFNGYQTWTISHEMKPSEFTPRSKAFVRFAGRPWGTTKYGDDFFLDYEERPGCFHGFSYMYRRRGDQFTLVASTDETNGYTIFYYDTVMGELKAVKDAGIGPGHDPALHIKIFEGTEDEVFDAWFEAAGITRRPAEPMAGYTSWYNRFDKITDETISEDLAGCSKVLEPGDMFQIDDGWQTAVGDWVVDSAKFPRGLKASVDDIHAHGFKAGLWLAPFSAQVGSELFKNHPDWLLKHDGKPWYAGCNWGGFFSLDIDKAAVRDHMKRVFDQVFDEWGFELVKLDFLYSAAPWPTSGGMHHGESRGARMHRAMELLREWCGDHMILGCGVPLMPAFGLVEYCRIGCDASLDWQNTRMMRQVNREIVSTRNAIGDSYYRRQLDGRAFLNDPDVFFLRKDNIKLTEEQKDLHARVLAQYGSFFLTSDNMGDYDEEQLAHYRELRRIWKQKDWHDTDFTELL
jgi:alpha-galactosidase